MTSIGTGPAGFEGLGDRVAVGFGPDRPMADREDLRPGDQPDPGGGGAGDHAVDDHGVVRRPRQPIRRGAGEAPDVHAQRGERGSSTIVTSTVVGLPSRTKVSACFEPTGRPAVRLRSPLPSATSTPANLTITSSGLSPALAAGPSGSTSSMTTPLPSTRRPFWTASRSALAKTTPR